MLNYLQSGSINCGGTLTSFQDLAGMLLKHLEGS